jgi:uncharacterized repeat protein (TIGR01451 family)
MRIRVGIVTRAVAFSLTLAAVAAAETPPVDVSAQSEECFQQNGTIPLSCDVECVSSQPCEDLHVFVCSNARILGGTPGSANHTSGGTFEQTTCTEPSQPFGASFTATGTIPPLTHDTVFFACVPSSLTGSTASFQISASDKTGQTATTTLTVPVCAASGPVLQVTKGLDYSAATVNGHFRVGDEVEFVIGVKNVGSAPTAGSVTLTDAPPAGLSVTKALTAAGPCSVAANTATCDNGFSLDPGKESFFFIFCKVTQKGDFENTATASAAGAPTAKSNAFAVEVRAPRPSVTRQGQQPLRDLRGNPIGNP